MQPVTPRKSLGQHFLVDPNTARKIVSSLDAGPNDLVVEIGPGLGALSRHLVDRYQDFTAVEIDERAAAHLQAEFPAMRVETRDVLGIDWRMFGASSNRALHVIGNLPYNISSPILFGLFDAADYIAEAVIMLQLEVARRIVARPRTKAYGILSVAAQLASEPAILFQVSRNVFRPPPKVTSAVVKLRFRTSEGGEVYSEAVRKVVRTAFNQRRKTLRNSLRKLTAERGVDIPAQWVSRRPEELTPEEFVELTRYLTR